jgi:hypothetical protein
MAMATRQRQLRSYSPEATAPCPRSGDVIHLTRAASVQFAAGLLFRVIRVHDWPTYDGWVWLDGYELDLEGNAVDRRSIFVQVAGLRQVGTAPDPRTRNGRKVSGQNSQATTAVRS